MRAWLGQISKNEAPIMRVSRAQADELSEQMLRASALKYY